MMDEQDDLSDLSPIATLTEEMQSVLRDFLHESYENLDRVDSELIELEEEPDSRELLSSIFRSIHTIKGTCAFFGFEKLEKVSHCGENLLVKLRDRECSMTEEMATALLSMVDAIRTMLSDISDHGHDGSNDHSQLIARFSALNNLPVAQSKAFPEPPKATTDHPVRAEFSTETAIADSVSGQAPAVSVSKTDQAECIAHDNNDAPIVHTSVRVDVRVLDELINLVGELVLTRNQIVEYVGPHEDARIAAAAQRLSTITSELQKGVMQTRMQPIHSIWAKLPRVVRDLSRACGKQVRVEMDGKTDRTG